MAVERRSPTARPLWPLDEDYRAFSDHVVETEIACLVGVTEPIAVDVIDGNRAGIVVVDQCVRGTRGARARAQTAADRLHQCRLARTQLTRQPDDHGSGEPGAEPLTEPAELARGNADRP